VAEKGRKNVKKKISTENGFKKKRALATTMTEFAIWYASCFKLKVIKTCDFSLANSEALVCVLK
jgi:hypothetical protein